MLLSALGPSIRPASLALFNFVAMVAVLNVLQLGGLHMRLNMQEPVYEQDLAMEVFRLTGWDRSQFDVVFFQGLHRLKHKSVTNRQLLTLRQNHTITFS
jgi:hypothetical protein